MHLGLNGLAGQKTPGQRTPPETATYPGAIPMDVGRCWLTERAAQPGATERGQTVSVECADVQLRAFLLHLGVGGLLVEEVKKRPRNGL
jgi:hypothetical protein